MAKSQTSVTDDEIAIGAHAASVNVNNLDLPPLTRQELEFAACLAALDNDHQLAADRVGISKQKGAAWKKREDIAQHVAALLANHKNQLMADVSYTLADAHADLQLGKRMAANAGEWFKGVELLMKLHRLNEPKPTEVEVNVNIEHKHQLEQIDDGQLLELAGFSFKDLLPEAVVVQGTCERVDDN